MLQVDSSGYCGPHKELVDEVLDLATTFQAARGPSPDFDNVEYLTNLAKAQHLHSEQESLVLSQDLQLLLFNEVVEEHKAHAWLDVREKIEELEVYSEAWSDWEKKHKDALSFDKLESYQLDLGKAFAVINDQLDSTDLSEVNWDLSSILKTVAKARAFRGTGSEFCETLFRFCKAGFWPCGFQGKWPSDGKFVLWYPQVPSSTPEPLPDSPVELLSFYRTNIGKSKSQSARALEALQLAAEASHGPAQYQLALRLERPEKLTWLARAVASDSADAALALMRECAKAGDEKVQNKTAEQWLAQAEKLALQGEDSAICRSVATVLLNRASSDQSLIDRSLKLFQRGAELGDAAASKSAQGLELSLLALGTSFAQLVHALCEKCGMSKSVSKAVAELVLPSRRALATSASASATGTGTTRSYLGGTPLLPTGIVWPTHANLALSFIAQIYLAEAELSRLHPAFPQSGRLLFFVDPASLFSHGQEGINSRVCFFDDKPGIAADVPDGVQEFSQVSLTFVDEPTLPFVRTALARNATGNEIETYQEIGEIVLASRLPPHRDGDVHRVLGHPDPIQGDMTRRIVYRDAGVEIDQEDPALELEASRLRLLLQVDSDSQAGMMWGNLGRLYFWIRDDDLKHGRWERVRCVMQSS